MKMNNENETKSDIFHFNDCKYQNFSGFWLKWTQTMEKKQNQVFFHGIHSNLTPYLSLSKNIKIFQWHSKSKFLCFMTKLAQTMGLKQNETFSMGHI